MNTGWSPESAARASLAGTAYTPQRRSRSVPRSTEPPPEPHSSDDAPPVRGTQTLKAWLDAVEHWAARCAANAVIAAGDTETPDLLVVGKAPGPDEARSGRAFSGPSGTELAHMLNALDRSIAIGGRVLATNASLWAIRAGESPSATALARTRPVLEALVRTEGLQAILALGGEAATALTGVERRSVSKLMGRWHRCRLAPDAPPVRVIYHPAYLLRSPHEAHRVRPELTEIRRHLARSRAD